jgi:UDP-N-acetylglucosamine 1-carboxyvinyltransferase
VLAAFRQAGAEVEVGADTVTVRALARPAPIRITTEPYPGFPTDVQAPFMAWLALGTGTSTIVETVFERRFGHVPELQRMGARITVRGDTARIHGVPRLMGATVTATDLRAAAALVLAGLAASGTTTLQGVEHLERGYAALPDTLRALGGDIRYSQRFSTLASPRTNG